MGFVVSHIKSLYTDTSDAGADLAWKDEVSRRVAELDSGVVQIITWSKVRSEAFKVRDN